MNKSTLGDFNIFDGINRATSIACNHFSVIMGMGIPSLRVPRKTKFIFGLSTAPTTILQIPP